MTTLTTSVNSNALLTNYTRIHSIDLIRGVVMILMALDHVRDYFHAEAFLFDPLDLEKTNGFLFFTRWITHFCAPTFVFLAGTSAYISGIKKGKRFLSVFLLNRGLWLIILELTVINFAWFFNIEFSLLVFVVIWVLGAGMIILAAVIYLPVKYIFIIGLVIISCHNLLDAIHFDGNGIATVGWAMIHEFRGFQFENVVLLVGYPILPWAGIMMVGYCCGKLFDKNVSFTSRRRTLLSMGTAMILLFLILRSLNVYGDPFPWSIQSSSFLTILSFINVHKYPASFLYVLITVGPMLIMLAVLENISTRILQPVIALGRVPMFFYLIHIYAIHLLAIGAAMATGFELKDMVFDTWVTESPNLIGYGFSLPVVYIVWAGVVLLLWPLCIRYDRYKSRNREMWIFSYL